MARQYVGVAPTEYIHLTLGDDTIDLQGSNRIDHMLKDKLPHDTMEDTPFRTQMQAGKKPGAGIMMAKVIQKIYIDQHLLAEPTPINIQQWDADIYTKLDGNIETKVPSSPPTTQLEAPEPSTKRTTTDQPHQPHIAATQIGRKLKTKGQECTPQKTPGKVFRPAKKKKPDPKSPDHSQKAPANKSPGFVVGDQKRKDHSKDEKPKYSLGKGRR